MLSCIRSAASSRCSAIPGYATLLGRTAFEFTRLHPLAPAADQLGEPSPQSFAADHGVRSSQSSRSARAEALLGTARA